jgi:hypothetical protein
MRRLQHDNLSLQIHRRHVVVRAERIGELDRRELELEVILALRFWSVVGAPELSESDSNLISELVPPSY